MATLKAAQTKYQLTLIRFPNEQTVSDVSQILYGSQDAKLVASLSSVPYTVGRSIPSAELRALEQQLRDLKVAFRFQNGNEVIEFDPTARKVAAPSEQQSLAPVQKKQAVGMYVFALIAVVFAAVAVWKLSTFSSHKRNSAEEAVNARARLEQFQNRVEVRANRELLWKAAQENMPLQVQDAVRTFEESRAKIHYTEGTQVVVRANTLLIIGEGETQNDERVRLEDGAIQAQLNASATPRRLSIETKAGVLEMQSPAPGERAPVTSVETEMTGDRLKVSVSNGKATLKPRNTNSAPVVIEKQQQLIATPTEVKSPEPFVPSLNLLLPADAATVHVDPQAQSKIEFQWEDISASRYKVLFSSDKTFSTIILSQETSSPRLQLNYLDIGALYWKVESLDADHLGVSETRKLNVQKLDH